MDKWFERPVLVLGTPRSGTSMVAGCLAQCGVWIGETFEGGGSINPTGFFEHKGLREQINKKILGGLRYDTSGIFPLPELSDLPNITDLKDEVRAILNAEGYDGRQPWLFKDAKLTLLWPLYLKAFPDAYWVVVSRDVDDYVASCLRTPFMKRYSDDVAFWRAHYDGYQERLILLRTQVAGRVLDVRSQDLIEGDLSTLRQVVETVGLTWREERILAFINPSFWQKTDERKLSEIEVDTMIKQAQTLQKNGEYAKAQQLYRDVLAHDAKHFKARHYLGLSFCQAGFFREGLPILIDSLHLAKDNAVAFSNVGAMAYQCGQLFQARVLLTRALLLQSTLFDAVLNLGVVCQALGDMRSAERYFKRAVLLNPDSEKLYRNLAVLYLEWGKPGQAIAVIQSLVAEQAEKPLFRQVLASAYLTLKRWREGWLAYDSRFAEGVFESFNRQYASLSWPEWSGELKEGLRLLVVGEQGFGDELMFAQCLPDLLAAGIECTLACDPRLLPIFKRTWPHVVLLERPLNEGQLTSYCFDYKIPLGSLPKFLRLRDRQFYAHNGYLSVDEKAVQSLRQEFLARHPGYLLVGIAWKGGRTFEDQRKRAIELVRWKSILCQKGVVFVVLHSGDALDELARVRSDFKDAVFVQGQGANFQNDLDHLFVHIGACDLVITVDNSVAHIGGALGTPTWVFLPKGADWRWHLHGDKTLWYPSVRLFRQVVSGFWSTPLKQACYALSRFVKCESLFSQAKDYLLSKKIKEGRDYLLRTLRTQPSYVSAIKMLALVDYQSGHKTLAIRRLREALSRDSILLMDVLAAFCQKSGRLDEAVDLFRAGLRLHPYDEGLLFGLAFLLQEMGRGRAARGIYQRLLRLYPLHNGALTNWGNLLGADFQFGTLLRNFQRHVRIEPNASEAHFSLSTLLLLLGDFQQGWREYEWRWQSYQRGKHRKDVDEMTLWQGQCLKGKRIFVWVEQGYGDVIMVSRFLPRLHALGAEVIFACFEPLMRLVKSSFDSITVVSSTLSASEADYHCPLMGLMRYFSVCENFALSQLRYLSVESDLCEVKVRKIDALNGDFLKIGFAWAGNSKHVNDHNRSIDLKLCEDLLNLERCRFFSLQHQHDGVLPDSVIDLSEYIHDFSDTAAIVEHLDVVVSIDSGVAHLAAALGKPTWILLPKVPDWRWKTLGERSYWYPTVRLFRQKNAGDWSSVLRRVKKALSSFFGMESYDDKRQVLFERGRQDLLEGEFERCLCVVSHLRQLDEDCPYAQFLEAEMCLLKREWGQGWSLYDARCQTARFSAWRRLFYQPQWRGESLVNQRILLWPEQSDGDCLLALRALPALSRKAGQVIVIGRPFWGKFVGVHFENITVLTEDDPLPNFDVHCPMLSLLAYEDLFDEVGSESEGYLSARPEDILQSQSVFDSEDGCRVGIFLDFDESSLDDFSLQAVLDVCQKYECVCYILTQVVDVVGRYELLVKTAKGETIYTIEHAGQLAGVIEQLDLVVAVDSVVAHMAGGMNRSVLLLTKSFNWRWGMNEDISCWYPSMRILRFGRDDCSLDVFDAALQDFVTEFAAE